MRVGVVGLGLVGGSFALALGRRHEIVGHDTDPEARRRAAAAGLAVVDRLDGLRGCDVVLVATPMTAVLSTLAALAPLGAVLADTSSVRAPVDAYAREHVSGARIVGLHPMAGRAASGFASAHAELFGGRPMLIVPTATTDEGALALARGLASDAGGVPIVCTADAHDRAVALTSALPLALATALAAATEGTDLATFAGPGYRDTTRLADTPADLAEAILLANSGNVVAAIARLRETLDAIEGAVAERDREALRTVLTRAVAARRALGQPSRASTS